MVSLVKERDELLLIVSHRVGGSAFALHIAIEHPFHGSIVGESLGLEQCFSTGYDLVALDEGGLARVVLDLVQAEPKPALLDPVALVVS